MTRTEATKFIEHAVDAAIAIHKKKQDRDPATIVKRQLIDLQKQIADLTKNAMAAGMIPDTQQDRATQIKAAEMALVKHEIEQALGRPATCQTEYQAKREREALCRDYLEARNGEAPLFSHLVLAEQLQR